jgi:hypothetical protein
LNTTSTAEADLIGPKLPIKVADIGKAGPRPAKDD